MKKTSFFFGIIFSIVGIASQAKDFTLLSPDKHLKVTVTDGNDWNYSKLPPFPLPF